MSNLTPWVSADEHVKTVRGAVAAAQRGELDSSDLDAVAAGGPDAAL